MKVRCIQSLCKQLSIHLCVQCFMYFLSFSLIHCRTGEAVFLSARHLQLHLYYVVNSYSFLPVLFCCKLPSQVLLAVVISTSSPHYFPFQYTANQLKYVFFSFLFFLFNMATMCCSNHIVIVIVIIRKVVTVWNDLLVTSGHRFNNPMLEEMCIFCMLSGFAFCSFIWS